MIPPAETLKAYLVDRQVAAELIRTDANTPTVSHASAALGVDADRIVKTVVFEGKRLPCVAVAILPGHLRADRQKVAAVLRLPALKLAQPDTVKVATGYEIGGVPPVGHVGSPAVVVDPRVLEHDMVFGGGSDEHHMLRISPADIVRLTGAIVADIIEEPSAP